ncbi:MAG: MmgE/PrpD family protein [Rhodospirillales bacterium]|nr:MmgE/PrpD family protein [Rhodospirillales bacterium]
MTPTVAERLADACLAAVPTPEVAATARRLMIDLAGICVAARATDFMAAARAGVDEGGPCTAIGLAGRYSPADAAMLNGTAAHGEDFDDTFEGGPVHAGAVILPAVLAAAERHATGGRAAMKAIAVGLEIACRMSVVVPKATHKAGFHPTAIFGAIGAAAAAGVLLGLDRNRLVAAMGIAGSFASGIIEYLAEGTWTKRVHPGWAAQSGYRAARLAAGGFSGPRTLFEGTHGLYKAFAHRIPDDWSGLLDGFGQRWVAETIAFKPYACGTMIHPYIDCAKRLAARGIVPEKIESIECETAEGILHRLWEPIATKRKPPNGYAAKFSIPYGVAAGFVLGHAGLAAFADEQVADPRLVTLAGKVSYIVDPANPYPNQFTGHVRVKLADGSIVEDRQPHFRGGANEPLGEDEIVEKFKLNCRYGGWSEARTQHLLDAAGALLAADRPVSLAEFGG